MESNDELVSRIGDDILGLDEAGMLTKDLIVEVIRRHLGNLGANFPVVPPVQESTSS